MLFEKKDVLDTMELKLYLPRVFRTGRCQLKVELLKVEMNKMSRNQSLRLFV